MMAGTNAASRVSGEGTVLLDGRRVDLDFLGRNRLDDDVRTHDLDFSWVNLASQWHGSLLKIFSGLLATHSLSYVSSCIHYVGRFAADCVLRGDPSEELALRMLEDWPLRYSASSWPFVRAVLGRWKRLRLPGLGQDVAEFLEEPERFEESGNGWYFALVANDPERGAFTEQELRSIRECLDLGFVEGRVSLEDWALTWFLIATGNRPVQMARIRISDVIVTTGPEGVEVTLAIPLAKGNGLSTGARWKRKAPSVLAEVLLRYIAMPGMRARGTGGPLFFEQSSQVSARIKLIFQKLRPHSDRLGGLLPVFPYRFRYTLGTRAIALGASDHEAARLLTHRTTHCIQYYRASLPTLQQPIGKAVGREMTFIAEAFQGRMIGSVDEATRVGEAGALIRDFAHLVGHTLGACGTHADCHQNAPRACLLCGKFEPLRDAPWEQFHEVLLLDLEQETEGRIRLITQEQIGAVRGIIAKRDRYLETLSS
jgi:integrase